MNSQSTPGPSAARRAVEIVSPDDDGVKFYLTKYKPFRLLSLQECQACKTPAMELLAMKDEN